MEIVFKICGQEVDPGKVKNPLTAAVLSRKAHATQKVLGPLKCSEHGGYPVVIFAGRNVENLTCKVGGCCNSFVQGITRRIQFML
ncbi:MAG: hypothetical protein WGN25_05095 [Candidatus Electrothrix sp. GW3-4]|uniref:hypothetical protein n=1 Tax=Candidatus Electrothrix sp. GW3-4 TaxID=3126740 RepID=UPI0030CB7DA8